MPTFIIDAENTITALTETELASIADGITSFGSEKELIKLAAEWPAERLVEIWNGIPGVAAVKRFTSRKAGAKRIWKRIQSLAGDGAGQAEKAEAKPRKSTKQGKKTAKRAKPAAKAAPARENSKKTVVLELLRRKGGCTLAEIMKETGWQAHSVRGFISGTLGKKMGLDVTSTKSEEGERTYSLPK